LVLAVVYFLQEIWIKIYDHGTEPEMTCHLEMLLKVLYKTGKKLIYPCNRPWRPIGL
jgi:hypothetical protein